MATLIGIVLGALVTWDLLMVTLGAAWQLSLSDRLGRLVFAVLRRLSRAGLGGVISEVSGVVIMVVVAGFWIVGFWTAWTLIYTGGDPALTVSRIGQEPEAIDRIAHTGHLLSTLGGAATEPASSLWDGVGALVGLNGMLALTLAVSFLFGVRGTVQQGRAFALLVATGETEPAALDGRVADLIAGLHATPTALWFGHRRPNRRLTHALLDYARQAHEAGGRRWARAQALLADLPHLDASPEQQDFLERLEAWAGRHEVERSEVRQDTSRRAA